MIRPIRVDHTKFFQAAIKTHSSLYIDSAEEVVSLFEVELQKPRNLSASESEERGHGEGGGVYATLLQSDTL